MSDRRFFQGFEWRLLFADTPSDVSSGGVTTTWAEGLLTSRTITFTLDQPTVIEAAVWPDDRRVNQLFVLDGEPLVAQSNRVVYAFRREGGSPPWVCRAAGILMSPQDEGDADIPLSHIVAYDAWKYLEGRPVIAPVDFPPDGNRLFEGPGATQPTGDYIVGTALALAIAADGFAFVDAGVAYGGTAFYGGTIETTDTIWFNLSKSMTVADVWRAMCDAGNCDVVLTPIYDPVNRPGYTHELNVYALAGSVRRTAVFAWDKLNRNCTDIDRMHDGTPGAFFNIVQAFAGQGGLPVPLLGPTVPSGTINQDSVDRFGAYWLMEFSVSQNAEDPTGSQVLAMAKQALVLHKQGQRTMTLKPTTGRAPIPLLEYGVGDRCPVYCTRRLRVLAEGLQRVQTIPIQITDEGVEEVPALLMSPDYRGDEDED